MPTKTITVGTDVATLLLFHPADLAHCHDYPIAWYAYAFAYAPEAAAGRLMAFGTGEDGGFVARLTTDGPTPREDALKGTPWTFRYRVNHGRVFLDNSDSLPGAEFRERDAAANYPERWFDLPNGDYAVTVYPIEWWSDAGAGYDVGGGAITGGDTNAENEVASYVIVFAPVASLDAVETAPLPVLLRCGRANAPRPLSPMWSPEAYEQASYGAPDGPIVVLQAPGAAILTGHDASIVVPDRYRVAVFDGPAAAGLDGDLSTLVVTATTEPGALALLARYSAASGGVNGPPQLHLSGGRLVRLERVHNRGKWLLAEVTPVARAQPEPNERKVAALKAAIEAYAAHHPDFGARVELGLSFGPRVASRNFELARMRSLATVEGLTTWLIHQLRLPLAEALRCLAEADGERVRMLLPLMSGVA